MFVFHYMTNFDYVKINSNFHNTHTSLVSPPHPPAGPEAPFVGPLPQCLIYFSHNWNLLTAVTNADMIFGFRKISHKPQNCDPDSQSSLKT